MYETKIGTNNSIKIEFRVKNGKEAWMELVTYSPEYIKTFILVLKNAIEDLKNKHNTLKYLVQTVTLEDWNDFLCKSHKWKVIEKNNNYGIVVISCDINDAIQLICSGLGFDFNL
jgi:hypothetical protein